MSHAKLAFDRVVGVASNDPRVVGAFLAGSRGMEPSYVTGYSDYDVFLIVVDEATEREYIRRFPSHHGDQVEVLVMTLDAFREYALPGTENEWAAYTFAHLTPLLDRLDGEIGSLLAEKGRRSPEDGALLLDRYINACYRSAKSQRDGRHLEAHLDAVEAIPSLLEFLFTACGRVRPYNKWLLWELDRHPLPKPWSSDVLVPLIKAILETGDPNSQQKIFRDVERFARARGYGAILDGWASDLDWLAGGRPDIAG